MESFGGSNKPAQDIVVVQEVSVYSYSYYSTQCELPTLSHSIKYKMSAFRTYLIGEQETIRGNIGEFICGCGRICTVTFSVLCSLSIQPRPIIALNRILSL